jgi:hypothetical protein
LHTYLTSSLDDGSPIRNLPQPCGLMYWAVLRRSYCTPTHTCILMQEIRERLLVASLSGCGCYTSAIYHERVCTNEIDASRCFSSALSMVAATQGQMTSGDCPAGTGVGSVPISCAASRSRLVLSTWCWTRTPSQAMCYSRSSCDIAGAGQAREQSLLTTKLVSDTAM